MCQLHMNNLLNKAIYQISKMILDKVQLRLFQKHDIFYRQFGLENNLFQYHYILNFRYAKYHRQIHYYLSLNH
jgi:hypothetical protein